MLIRPSLILALVVGGSIAAAAAYWQPGFIVVDGDTVRHGFWKWRLDGIDAPSPRTNGWSHAKCSAEVARGLKAKARVAELVAGGSARMAATGARDPYGNPLGHLTVMAGGVERSAGDVLVAEGLARPWNGRGPKPDWCVN